MELIGIIIGVVALFIAYLTYKESKNNNNNITAKRDVNLNSGVNLNVSNNDIELQQEILSLLQINNLTNKRDHRFSKKNIEKVLRSIKFLDNISYYVNLLLLYPSFAIGVFIFFSEGNFFSGVISVFMIYTPLVIVILLPIKWYLTRKIKVKIRVFDLNQAELTYLVGLLDSMNWKVDDMHKKIDDIITKIMNKGYTL